MITPEENLKSIIDDIQKNNIMLPDFQRRFDWGLEKQKGLVASVLTKLPVGGILLLEAKSDDYKSKRIGLDSKEVITGIIPPKTNFLLDGQQRMTCLTNVFSDVIHLSSEKKVSKLSSRQLLATRFYLRIEKWDSNIIPGSDKDLFGIRSLDFRFDVSKNDEPEFLTADIIDYIDCRAFFANDYNDKPYAPCKRYDENLDDYCFSTPGYYLIPLFLLVGTDEQDDKLRKKRLLAIIKKIRDSISEAITTHYMNLITDDLKDSFAYTIITDSVDRASYDESEGKDQLFEDLVIDKAELWADYFQKYLYSCIEKTKLTKIEMPEGSRARAIDIYENMNRGGLSLSTLDLVAARVAKVSPESLYDRIMKSISNNNEYYFSAIPKEIKTYIPQNYNASKSIGALEDNRLSKICTDLFLEVLGLYCNNKKYESNLARCSFSKSDAILRLSDNEINNNCEKVCISLDRAFCFLQTRCGIRSLKEVNYKLMIRLIAYIFTNDRWYKMDSVHDKLEAWYWSAVFSGEYDKDQNERYEKNLKSMLDSFSVTKNFDWIVSLKNNILNTAYFSDCEFLLMEKANEDRVPKEHLSKYFCQFYLSRPYSDLIDDEKTVSVFSKEKLEKHHIIPLGSVTKIGESSDKLRNDKNNIANSPLNYAYITSSTNNTISDKSLLEYEAAITPQAKSALYIMSYPSVTDLGDFSKVKKWLEDRHKTIRGVIQNRVTVLLGT